MAKSCLKRILQVLIVSLCCLVLIASPAYALSIGAKGAILIDSLTGQVLWQQNGYEALSPASTTKVFTALTALDLMPLDYACLVSPQAAAVGESSAHLQTGEEMPLEDLLTCSLIKSANDACYAIGENVAGSEELFVHLLNLKAQALGGYNSHFVNTNGLPNQEHRLSPYDLALASRMAMTNQVFRKLVKSPTAVVENGAFTRYLKNTNKLLTSQPNVIGVKTGTTNEAGACLVAAMKKDGREVISVVLHSPDRYKESMALLNYGINDFTNVHYLKKGQLAAYYPLANAAEPGVWLQAAGLGVATVPSAKVAAAQVRIVWRQNISPPVKQGDTLAWAELVDANGQIYSRVNLEATNSVAKEGIHSLLEKFKQT